MSEKLKCLNCGKEKNHWLYVWNYENEHSEVAARIAICLDCYKSGDEESKNKIARIICDTLVIATELLSTRNR